MAAQFNIEQLIEQRPPNSVLLKRGNHIIEYIRQEGDHFYLYTAINYTYDGEIDTVANNIPFIDISIKSFMSHGYHILTWN